MRESNECIEVKKLTKLEMHLLNVELPLLFDDITSHFIKSSFKSLEAFRINPWLGSINILFFFILFQKLVWSSNDHFVWIFDFFLYLFNNQSITQSMNVSLQFFD